MYRYKHNKDAKNEQKESNGSVESSNDKDRIIVHDNTPNYEHNKTQEQEIIHGEQKEHKITQETQNEHKEYKIIQNEHKETQNKLPVIGNSQLLKLVTLDLSEFPDVRFDNSLQSKLIVSNSMKITEEHLDNCNCYREVLNYYIRKNIIDTMDTDENNNYKNELGSNYSDLVNIDFTEAINCRYIQKKYSSIYKNALTEASEFINDHSLVCPHVYSELNNTIQLFDKDYDLNTAKVQMVVRSILSYQSSQIESMNHFTRTGMFEYSYDKQGNSRKKISSNEWYRMNLNEKIIDAVEKLDKMIEGNKNVNLNIDSKTISMNDVLRKLKNDKNNEDN